MVLSKGQGNPWEMELLIAEELAYISNDFAVVTISFHINLKFI